MKRVAGPNARATLVSTVAFAPLASFILAALAALAPAGARAADMNAVNNAARIASGVGAGAAAPALGVGAVLQTVVGLAVVIALVFGSAWIARRLGFQPAKRSGLVKTIGGASLGGKERVAVVEIGDTWLVLGAAPGNVRLLHRMPAGTTTAGEATDVAAFSGDAQDALPGTFGQRFRDAMKGEVRKRFNRRPGGDR